MTLVRLLGIPFDPLRQGPVAAATANGGGWGFFGRPGFKFGSGGSATFPRVNTVFRAGSRYRRGAAAVVVVCLLVTVLTAAGAGAQPAAEPQPTQEDIEQRDGLIADQESLLNTYRCLFGVDTHVVPGGCVDGQPSGGRTHPGVFEGTPTQRDVDVRDSLIADQEALLNVYRCQFDVDLELVPEGCPDQTALTDPHNNDDDNWTDDQIPTENQTVVPWYPRFSTNWDLMQHLASTCHTVNHDYGDVPINYLSDSSKTVKFKCETPSDELEINRITTEVYGCKNHIYHQTIETGFVNRVKCPVDRIVFGVWSFTKQVCLADIDGPSWARVPGSFSWCFRPIGRWIGNACPTSIHSGWAWWADENTQLCYRRDHPDHPFNRS